MSIKAQGKYRINRSGGDSWGFVWVRRKFVFDYKSQVRIWIRNSICFFHVNFCSLLSKQYQVDKYLFLTVCGKGKMASVHSIPYNKFSIKWHARGSVKHKNEFRFGLQITKLHSIMLALSLMSFAYWRWHRIVVNMKLPQAIHS